MKKNYNILAISHVFIKRINISFYENLAKQKNFKVTCIYPSKLTINNKVCYPDFKNYKGNTKIVKSNLIHKTSRFFYFSNLKKYILSEKPNLIIVDNDPVTLQSLIVIFYSFFFDYKICYFCNENNIKNIFKKFTIKKFFKFFVIFSINFIIKSRVHRIFCYTNQIKENYDFLGYRKKTCVMPLGYDPKVFNLINRKTKKKNFVISYFGRINKDKGIHILINSLKKINTSKWKLLLDIDYIDDKIYFKKILKDLKTNFKKSQFSCIKADHYKISDYMKKSDLVILPSIYEEQYGRVIQEAVACGNIAIGSKIGGIPEIIKDKELLFDPGNYNKLAHIIKRFMNKKKFNIKFKKIHARILNERTIFKQMYIFKKFLDKKL